MVHGDLEEALDALIVVERTEVERLEAEIERRRRFLEELIMRKGQGSRPPAPARTGPRLKVARKRDPEESWADRIDAVLSAHPDRRLSTPEIVRKLQEQGAPFKDGATPPDVIVRSALTRTAAAKGWNSKKIGFRVYWWKTGSTPEAAGAGKEGTR